MACGLHFPRPRWKIAAMNHAAQNAAIAQPVRHHAGMEVIAIFKLIKGVLLLAAAFGFLKLVHTDLSALVEHWVTVLRMDPDSERINALLEKVAGIDRHTLRQMSLGSFLYTALLLTEGRRLSPMARVGPL